MAFECTGSWGLRRPFIHFFSASILKMAAARLTRDNNRSAWGRLCKPDKHANAAQAQPRDPASRERPWLGCSETEPVNSGEVAKPKQCHQSGSSVAAVVPAGDLALGSKGKLTIARVPQ